MDPDEFADLADPAEEFSDLAEAQTPAPPEETPPGGTDRAQFGEVRPPGMVETGRVSRRLELPEMTGLERTGEEVLARGPVRQVEEREVRAPTIGERGLASFYQTPMGQGVQRGFSAFGLEAPSPDSLSRAAALIDRPREQRQPGDITDALMSTIGTAPRPEGMSPSESDTRTYAGVQGLGTGNPLVGPWLDELSGLTGLARGQEYTQARDQARQQMARTAESAPEASLLGSAAPALGMGLAGGPTAGSAIGRIGQAAGVGAGLGALGGAGRAAELSDVPAEAGLGALIEGGLAGAGQGAGEGLGAAWRAIANAHPRFASRATQAGLEARGVWGGRALGAADELPGGREGLLADLERLGIGVGGDTPTRSIPRPDQALDDIASVARRVSRDYGDVTSQIAAAGNPRVDVQPVARDMLAQAQRLERSPIGGERLYRSITENVVDPLTRPRTLSTGEVLDPSAGLPFDEAAQQRTVLRRLEGMGRQGVTESLAATREQLEAARRGLRPQMLSALENAPPSPLAGLAAQPSRSLRVHRMAFQGLTPEQATEVATGVRPPVAGGGNWEPIRIDIEENGTVSLLDGNHRLAAAREAGATRIVARVREFLPGGGEREAVRILPIDEASDAAARSQLAELGGRWNRIDRDYAILQNLEEIGGGSSRLSTGGGMAGAAAQAIENTVGGVPLVGGFIQRQLAQEQRMLMPGIQASVMRRLATGSPRLQQFARQLAEAGVRGPNAVAATHYILSQQDPEYRAAAEAAQQEQP